jgi:PAS domain S-box-containing protein
LSYRAALAKQRQQQPTWAKYLVGFGAALVASAVTIIYRTHLEQVMFIAFWPAVIFTAWFCGLGPSLIVSGVAILVVDYYFLEPTGTLSPSDIGEVVPLALFFLTSTVVNSLAVSADRSRERAETALADLADRAHVLEEQAGELEMQREELRSLTEELEESVAELEAANREAEAARAELSDVLTALPDATIAYDGEWRAIFLNPAAEAALRATGIDPQMVLGRKMWEVFDTEGPALRAAATRVETTGQMLDFEHRWAVLDRWFHHRLLKTKSGYVVHSRDITEEREAAETRERLAAIVDFSEDAIISKRLDGTITSWNAGAERMFGYAADEIIGRPMRTIIPADLQSEDDQIIAAMRRGEHIHHYDTVGLRKDGRRFDVSISVSPVRDGGGEIVGAARIARDVSDRKRAEAEERTARLAAEAANRAKSNFLAVMSHELRTPLNAIAGYVELIEMGLRGPITDQQRTDLSRIRRSQVNLLGLIDDILQFARIESGRLVVEPRHVVLDTVLCDMRTFIEPQLLEKQQRFVYRGCDSALKASVDSDKLGQIVINLLTNAVKFTGHGGTIELACGVNADHVEISVRDTGSGIQPADLERIFEPFVQLDMGPTRTVHGTGLGLAISRDLAQAMGGSIAVESTPGVGSVFTVRLPRTGTASGARQPSARAVAATH